MQLPWRPHLVSLALLLAPPLAAQDVLGELHRAVPPTESHGTSLATGDVDGDGDLDVIAATSGAPNALLRGAGDGSFTRELLPAVAVDNSAAAALGDVDGDGDPDLLFACFAPAGGPAGAAQDRLLRNDGAGTFVETAGLLPAESVDGEDVAVGDVDLDGDLDAFVAQGFGLAGGAQPSVLLVGDGTGAFTVSGGLAAAAHTSGVALMEDLDGDGDLDLFEGGGTVTGATIHENDGTGVFTVAAGAVPRAWSGTSDAAIGDIDGDLDPDLLVVGGDGPDADVVGGEARLWLNDGSGSFTDAPSQLPVTERAYEGLLADLDGDGDRDVALADAGPGLGDGDDALFVNDGSGAFAAAHGRLPAGSTATLDLVAADVEGDGDVDLLLAEDAGSTAETTRLYRSDGVDFTDVTAPLAGTALARAVALADLDGDGDLDAAGTGQQGLDRVLLNDGNGVLEPGPDFPQQAADLAFGDVDGDGDPDALVVGGEPLLELHLNDGAAGLSPGPAMPQRSAPSEAAFADVEGDGDLDVLIAQGEFSPVANGLLVGDGTGAFADASGQLPAVVAKSSAAVAAGDVDGDGDADVLFGSFSANDLHLNDGSGVFADAPGALPAAGGPTHAVGLADVDADGDLDALIGAGFPFTLAARNRLHLNDGTGAFTDAPGQVPDLEGVTADLALGDPDGDGDVDVYFANVDDAPDELWLNDGAGSFALGSGVPAGPHVSVAMGDLDGDGDDDALVAADEAVGLRQLYGLARHVAWRATPAIGKPLEMRLFGDPLSLWVLASSAQTAQADLGALGTLGIDPGKLITLDVGLTGADGAAAKAYAVPAQPALVGADLWWQAVVGATGAFTNVERARFTDL